MEIQATEDQVKHILQLSNQRIDFEPVSKNVSVFYDESNKQVSFLS